MGVRQRLANYILGNGYIDNVEGKGQDMSDTELGKMVQDNGHVQQQSISDAELAKLVQSIEEIVLPVQTDRQTLPDTVTVLTMLQNLRMIKPQFEMDLLEAIEHLAMFNPDVSKALENIALALTERTVYFDKTVSANDQAKMLDHLKKARAKWYNYSEGHSGLMNDMLTQLALAGALSYEAVPNSRLSGIEYVTLVAPKNIVFMRDEKTKNYIPYQKLPSTSVYNFDVSARGGYYKELNTLTYKYVALKRIGEYPYGIPPFLSALENLVIQKKMVVQLETIITRLGLMGFLKVLINKPQPKQGEKPEDFAIRCGIELQRNIAEIKKGFGVGFMGGYKDSADIEMQKVDTNATGGEKLLDINDRYVITGLKEDGSMMNRPNSTTETFARIVLAVKTKQLSLYQNALKSALDHLDLLELQLAGFKITFLESEFDKVMLGDALNDENAYGKKIENSNALYDAGIINKVTQANILGYDKPDQLESRSPSSAPSPVGGAKPSETPSNKTAPTKVGATKDAAAVDYYFGLLGGNILPFQYDAGDHVNCNHTHVESYGDPLNQFEEDYSASIEAIFGKASRRVSEAIGRQISKLQEGASLEQVRSTIMLTLYREWQSQFSDKIKPKVGEFVDEVYKTFRKDQTPFKGASVKIPEVSLDLPDLRAIEFYKKSDGLYLGKFITDPDTRKRINSYIVDQYLGEGMPIGNTNGLDKFIADFTDTLDMERWKIRRIVDTTVNKMRNTASIMYMDQAGVDKFKIVGINDKMRCQYCADMQNADRSFSIGSAVTQIDRLTANDPEMTPYISPFITNAGTPEEVSKMSSEDIQSYGAAMPGYHPHCRCRAVVDL